MTDSSIAILTRRVKKLEGELTAVKRQSFIAPFHALKAKLVTIAAHAIVATRPNIALLPETGTADELKLIGNFDDGKFIILAPAHLGDVITIKDYSGVVGGNIDLGGDDIELSAQGDNLMLYYVGATSKWQIASSMTDGGGGGGGPLTLNDLSDVDTSPDDNDALFWSELNNEWEAGKPWPKNLDDLSGVVINMGTLATGQVIMLDGAGTWVNHDLPGGGGGGDLNYTHSQLSASATWNVTHGLGKFPSVSVVDSAGTVVIGDITYIDDMSLTISFTAAFAGLAYMN